MSDETLGCAQQGLHLCDQARVRLLGQVRHFTDHENRHAHQPPWFEQHDTPLPQWPELLSWIADPALGPVVQADPSDCYQEIWATP
jgi:hypothetical protein